MSGASLRGAGAFPVNASATVSVTFPAPLQAGDLMFIWCASNGLAAYTWSCPGFSAVAAAPFVSGDATAQFLYKTATATDAANALAGTAYTVTISSAQNWVAVAGAYGGVLPAPAVFDPLPANSGTPGSGTSVAGAGFTAANAGDQLLWFGASGASSGALPTITQPAGFTVQAPQAGTSAGSGTNICALMADKVNGAAGAVAAQNGTLSATHGNVGFMVALTPALPALAAPTFPLQATAQALPAGYQGGPAGAGSVTPSALGNGWEIEVRSSQDYTTLLAVIPPSMLENFQFVRQLNDIGSGTVVLNQDDPWWSTVSFTVPVTSFTWTYEQPGISGAGFFSPGGLVALTRSTAWSATGGASLLATVTAQPTSRWFMYETILTPTAGQKLLVTAQVYAPQALANVQLSTDFKTSGGTFLATSASPAINLAAGQTAKLSYVTTAAPAGTGSAATGVNVLTGSPIGTELFIDNLTYTLLDVQPSSTLLDEECLWQVWKDGVCRFEFLGETVTEQLVDQSEQRQATVTGPGTIATLKWAMVAPQGFPNIVLKLDGLLDAFDEVDNNGNPVLDTNIWTTASPAADVNITPIAVIFNYPTGAGYALSTLYPSGSLTLTATPGTTFLGASPYDATDTLISAQITPIGVSSSATDSTTPAAYGTGLNGSELTQFYIQSNFNSGNYALIGLSGSAFYAQLGTNGSTQTKILPPYDSQNHAYWMITEQAGSGGGQGTFYFWTSPDGQQWTLQWQVVHSWDATNTTFFVTAAYSVAGTESVVLSNLNSNVTTPSYQGDIYLGEPMMGVWFDQFTKAQARGTIPFVTTVATPTADSYGRPWTDVENVQAVNGTDLYSFLQGAVSVVDADYVMDPGFQLRVGVPATGQVALGVDRSSYLIFRDGYDVMARQRVRARDSIATLIGGENSDGHEISASAPAFIAEWGQREAWFQTAAQVDPVSMAYATASSLAENETEIVSWTFSLRPGVPGKLVFDNFDVGDWVGLERPDFSAVDIVRVVGIAVQVDSSGTETHELTFQSYIQWLAEQLTYLANKLGGAFINTQGTTPVAPSKFGTGQVPTYFTPAATLQGLADVATHSIGSAQSNAPLVYNPATGQYQAAGSTDPVSGQMVPVTVSTPSGSVTVGDTTVVVSTGNGSTVSGLQGDGTVTSVDVGGSAPAIPDAPTVAGIAQGLSIAWDGLLTGVPPLSNFRYVQVYVGTTSGFTPSAATLVGTMTTAGALTVSGLTAGTTYFVKLVAVTTSGVASAPSGVASAVAQALPTTALTGQLPASLLGNSAGSWALNPNPFFNGGDLTGWFVTNGTVSAIAPPAGAPGNPQFAARVVSTAANCLLTGSPAPFTVVPGQPYAMTAWVWNPGGSAVTVAAGFNWASGTGTVSCPAGAWTPVTSIQICPVGVTSAYQVVGPTASGVTVYITGAVAAGQVSGQLLVANSVTANQIAANTITAAQIAAATITASQIAANTITAAKIAASTITAAQIAASTITAAQIAANTITASQIAAGTITASQIAAGIILAGVVNGTTITGAQIVADGTNGEILVYAGTPATGNLIGSWSATAGTDGHSNSYNAGLWIYDSGGNSIGLVPGGSSASSQIALSTGNGTPTPPAGSAALYGAASGAVQAVDGTDGQTYSVSARRSLVLGSNATVSSSTYANLFTSHVAAPGGTARTYRVSAVLFISNGTSGVAGIQMTGPAGATGFFSVLYTATTNTFEFGIAGFGASMANGFVTASGLAITARLEGTFTVPAGVSGTLALQVATTGSSYFVRQGSVFDIGPV